jgi:hypothetical protein
MREAGEIGITGSIVADRTDSAMDLRAEAISPKLESLRRVITAACSASYSATIV